MIKKIVTVLAVVGSLIMVILVLIDHFTGFQAPLLLKGILWITILSFVLRILLKNRDKK